MIARLGCSAYEWAWLERQGCFLYRWGDNGRRSYSATNLLLARLALALRGEDRTLVRSLVMGKIGIASLWTDTWLGYQRLQADGSVVKGRLLLAPFRQELPVPSREALIEEGWER